jgi:hypothetical protein
MINEKSSNAKPALIFAILLVIIMALGAIVYLAMFKKTLPITVQPVTNPKTEIDVSDWNIYKNEKFGYEIKYPQTINCEQELGIGIDPADNYICSLKKQNNLFISIKPQIIESSQDRISFYRSAKMGSIDTVDIQNKDILATISNYMESIDFIALNKSNFVALNDTNNLIGFSKTESYNSNTPTPAIWYDESWFFIHDNVLFAVYISYDGLQQNSNAELSQISDLKSIITTLTFYKPSGTNADPQYNTNIADWKTYKNEKFGYEIKYPSNWFTYDYYYNGEKHPENLYIQNFSRPEEGGFSGIGGAGCQLNVWVESEKYVSIQDWIDVRKNNFGKDLEKVTTKEAELGGVKGLEVIFSGSFLGSGDPAIVILNNGILYKIIEYWQDVPQEKCQPAFDKILSTFEFIK